MFKSIKEKIANARFANSPLSQAEAMERACEVTTAPEDGVEYVRRSEHDRNVADLTLMVRAFRNCVEQGVIPKQGSRCHAKIIELVGNSEGDDNDS